MTETMSQVAAGAAHEEYETDAERLEREASLQPAISAIDKLFNAHSIRLDIVRSTVRALKVAMYNHPDQSQPMDTPYVVNMLEAIEQLIPDEEALRERVLDAAERSEPPAPPPEIEPQTRVVKRARREAIGSAA